MTITQTQCAPPPPRFIGLERTRRILRENGIIYAIRQPKRKRHDGARDDGDAPGSVFPNRRARRAWYNTSPRPSIQQTYQITRPVHVALRRQAGYQDRCKTKGSSDKAQSMTAPNDDAAEGTGGIMRYG